MEEQEINITDPKYYENREISWLDFNIRVIAEAEDSNNPLFEQLKFLAIGSSNLDEFIRVRVAGLQDQSKLGVTEPDSKKQWTPSEQLDEIAIKNEKNVEHQYDLYNKKVNELKEHGLEHLSLDDLSPEQKKKTEKIFEQDIQPAITPYGVDAYRPFPHLNDGIIHLFVKLERDNEPFIAIVPISPLLDRYQIIEDGASKKIIFTEDIVRLNIDNLFKGFDLQYTFAFRITRNADLELQEEGAEDLLSVIEDYLERRKNGMSVRLEVDTRNTPANFTKDVGYLMQELDLLERDIYAINGPLDLTYINDLVDEFEDDFPGLVFSSFQPSYPPALVRDTVFNVADKQDIFLHHPYDSFKPIIEMVEEAVDSPNTVSIKQTLYRVSSDSPLVKALKRGAKKGIQVTVLVELKARFDEANNVHWAKEMEDAGVHVLYGVKELKTHSKATLIVSKTDNGFKRYVHLGTGNYNEKTARGYTDMGLITTREALTEDVANFFNYLSGYSEQPNYNHLHVSPHEIRDTFIHKIQKVIEAHKEHGNGRIIAKMNSLTDKVLIMKLFEASQEGVKIDLIVRGISCLIPGIPGVSENIRIRSVVGRFLEHSRIYYFKQHNEEKLYLSSADMMTRNMVKRVELAFPITDEEIRKEVLHIIDLYMEDNTKAWSQQSDGKYVKRTPEEGEEPLSVQEALLEKAETVKEIEVEKEHKNWFSRLSEKLLGNRYRY